ncbi:MAG: hypothetical protein Q8M37_12975 [Nevskia sp.]|nr:hypothetical protein [Nevskia sp.]
MATQTIEAVALARLWVVESIRAAMTGLIGSGVFRVDMAVIDSATK